jgi:pullulanase/glycogen debranching enzyme
MMLSHGTPMLLAGDEFGHSQKGSNNAYAQDNETTWLDWLASVRRAVLARVYPQVDRHAKSLSDSLP